MLNGIIDDVRRYILDNISNHDMLHTVKQISLEYNILVNEGIQINRFLISTENENYTLDVYMRNGKIPFSNYSAQKATSNFPIRSGRSYLQWGVSIHGRTFLATQRSYDNEDMNVP